MWDEITYPFLNFTEVWAQFNKYVPWHLNTELSHIPKWSTKSTALWLPPFQPHDNYSQYTGSSSVSVNTTYICLAVAGCRSHSWLSHCCYSWRSWCKTKWESCVFVIFHRASNYQQVYLSCSNLFILSPCCPVMGGLPASQSLTLAG